MHIMKIIIKKPQCYNKEFIKDGWYYYPMKFKNLQLILVVLFLLILFPSVFAEQSVKSIIIPLDFEPTPENDVIYYRNVTVNPPDGIEEIMSFEFLLTADYPTSTYVYAGLDDGAGGVLYCDPMFWLTPSFSVGNYEMSFDCTNLINEYDWKGSPDPMTFGWLSAGLGVPTNLKPRFSMTYYNKPTAEITVHGTEYTANDDGRMFIQLLNDIYQPIENASCYSSIYYPDNSVFKYKQAMSYVDEGLYYYDFKAPYPKGIYMVSVYCVTPEIDTHWQEISDDFETGTIDGGNGWNEDWVLNGALIDGSEGVGGTYGLRVTDDLPERQFPGDFEDSSINIEFDWRSRSLDNNGEFFYVYLDDANGTSHLLLTISNGEDDDVWHDSSTTLYPNIDNIELDGNLTFRVADSGNLGNADYLFLDNIFINLNHEVLVNSTEYQEVRGTGEIHIISDYDYSITTTNGQLYNDSFLNGFYQEYEIVSQVIVPTAEVPVTVYLKKSFPCTHVLNMQSYNGSDWNNISYSAYTNPYTGICEVTGLIDLDFLETTKVRVDNLNFWKNYVFTKYKSLVLIDEYISRSCYGYIEENNLDNFSLTFDAMVYGDDAYYNGCQDFLRGFEHYKQHIVEEFIPIHQGVFNFTEHEMNELENNYLHVDDISNGLVQRANTLVGGMNLGASYGLTLMNRPEAYGTEDYMLFFANVSTSYQTFLQTLSTQSLINVLQTNVTTEIDNAKLEMLLEMDNIFNELNLSLNDIDVYQKVALYNILTEINSTNYNIYNYLQNTIFTEIDQAEEKLDELLLNSTNIWDELVDVHTDVLINRAELDITQLMLENVNTTLKIEIDENEVKIDLIQNLLDSVAYEINNTLSPKLDIITSNIATMQSDIDTLKLYTDTLESGQSNILAELNTIDDSLISLNNTILTNYNYLVNLDSDIDADFIQIQNNITTILADIESSKNTILGQTTITHNKLDDLTTSTNIINSTVNDIYSYLQNDIQAEFTGLNNVLSEINLTVESISTYLSDTIYPEIDNVEEDIADLKLNLTTNFGYIVGELNTIDSSIATVDGKLVVLSSLLVDVNQSIIDEIVINRNRINDANLNLSYVRDYLELYIPTITNSLSALNTTLLEIDNYQKTAIYNLLTDINNTNYDIYSYLQTVIYPAVDTVENSLSDILINTSNIYDEIVTLTADVQINYAQLIILNSLVESTNQSIINEINENEVRLIILDIILNSVATEINDTVVPAISDVNTEIGFMQSNLTLIQNYVDSLESGQTNILDAVSDIDSNILILNNSINGITDFVGILNSSIETQFDDIQNNITSILYAIENTPSYDDTVLLSLISNLQTSATQINTTVNGVETYMLNDIQDDIDYIISMANDINLTVDSLYDYTQNTIYPEIDNVEELLSESLTNTTNIWNKLLEVDTQTETNYNQLVIINSAITSVNDTVQGIETSIVSEINENEVKLDSIITTVNNIETRILNVIEPKLDIISDNITIVQSDLNIIKGYTDTLETGQITIIADLLNITETQAELLSGQIGISDSINETHTLLSSINNTIVSSIDATNIALNGRFDTVDGTLLEIQNNMTVNTENILSDLSLAINNISIVQDQLDCVHTTNVLCDKIDSLSISLVGMNDSIVEIDSYLKGDITNYLININATVEDIYSYLQNSIYPKIEDNYNAIQTILGNQTLIFSDLVNIQNDITTNYDEILIAQNLVYLTNLSLHSEFNSLSNTLYAMNTTILEEINANENYLQNINDTVTITQNLVNTVLIPTLSGIGANITTIENTLDGLVTTITPINNKLIELNTSINYLVTNLDILNFTINDGFDSSYQDIINSTSVLLNLIEQTSINLSCSEDSIEICNLLNGLESDLVVISDSIADLSITTGSGNYTSYFNDINFTVNAIQDYQENLMYPSIIDYFQDQTVVTVSNMHRVVINNDYTVEVTLYNPYSEAIIPDSEPELTITDALDNNVIANIDMIYVEDGLYKFNYSVGGSANPGVWTSTIKVVVDGEIQYIYDKWNVISNPTEVTVEVVSLCNMEVCADVTITNEGTTAYEYIYNYWTTDDPLSNYAESGMFDGGQASKLLSPGETFVTTVCLDKPATSNTHYFRARTYYGEYSFATDSFTNNVACREKVSNRITGNAIQIITDFAGATPVMVSLGISAVFLMFFFTKIKKWDLIRKNDDENPIRIWYNLDGDVGLYVFDKGNSFMVELAKNDENKEYDKGDVIFTKEFFEKKEVLKYAKNYMNENPEGN